MARPVLDEPTMGGLRSCEQLRREHALIGRVVNGLDRLAQRRPDAAGGGFPLPVAGALDFFAGYVARCHDVKEDEALFPALTAHGAVDGGLVDAIRRDHEEGDRVLGVLRADSGRHRLNGERWPLLERYLALVRRHIATEDGALLPLAEQVLSPDDDAAVERSFAAIEERALGRGGAEALVALADAIATAAESVAADDPGAGGHLVARDIMRARAATVGPDASLARAAELMESFGTRELAVVRDGALVGIVTRTDMEPHRGHYEWTTVRAAMTSEPVSIAPDTPVPAVARLLLGRGFNALPVTEHGALRGMISRSDVLRALSDAEPGS